MIETTYFGKIELEVWEFALLPFYLLLILIFSARVKRINLKAHPEYKYYMTGLYAKIFGGLAFALVYLYYYGGGDTISYYETSLAFVNLFNKSPQHFFEAYFNPFRPEMRYYFDNTTGYPLGYIWHVPSTFMVVRIITPIVYIANKSYLVSTLLVSWVTYFGVWRAYSSLCRMFKGNDLRFAWAFLFFPSVVFWGSGILKDSFTFTSACWMFYLTGEVFIRKTKGRIWKLLALLFFAYIIFSIKAYIFISLLPGLFIWISFDRIKRIQNQLIAAIILPVAVLIIPSFGIGGMAVLGDSLGEYSINNIAYKAAITQADLSNTELYSDNAFSIGQIDPTFGGMLSKFPLATVYGLFGPFIWQVKNAVAAFSSIETSILMLILIYLLFKLRLFQFFRFFYKDPIIIFTLSFSILFAFGLGLTTANFGALVRFKIPMLPFFASALIIVNHYRLESILVKSWSKRQLGKIKRNIKPSSVPIS